MGETMVMGALDGLRVIEIANWAAAPSAGALLAEQGAEVIKVEPLGGDSMRGLMHQAGIEGNTIDHPFQFSNRQKKSVAIALDTDAGRQVAVDLIAESDVVITNLLRQRRTRFGLTQQELHEANPSLVIAILTGFGEVGPDAQTPGYDLTSFFARSGLSASVGGMDGQPPRWRQAQGDHVAGLSLYSGIMTALVKRASTGEGAVVETSLLQAATWSNAFDLTRAAADGRPARAKGRLGSVNVTSECFLCADDRYIQLSLAEPVKGWRIMCEVLELGELEHDERFVDTMQRFVNMAEAIDIFEAEIAERNSAELVDAITSRGGVAAVVQQSHEVVADPQVKAIGVLRPVVVPGGTIEVVNAPFSVDGSALDGVDQGVDGIGEPGADTDTVLASILDLDKSAIDELVAHGVVGRGSH